MANGSNYASAGDITGSVNALKYDIEENLPYFVFVESVPQVEIPDVQPRDEKYLLTGKIAFCGKDKAPIFSLGKNGYYTLDTIEINSISKYLYRTRPMKNEDGSGWIIPLYEGNDFSSQKSVNAYFHNLMFWESQLPNSSFGPLTLRFIDTLMKGCRQNGHGSGSHDNDARPWVIRPACGEIEKMHGRMMAKIRIEEIRNEIDKKTDMMRQAETELQHQTDAIRMFERECERLEQSATGLKSEIDDLHDELKKLSEHALQE